VFTGKGKGKTTAALGLVLRAAGHGMRSIVAHVMKTPNYKGDYVGEYKAINALLRDYVEEYFLGGNHRTPRDVFRYAVARSIEVKPHLLVLDEVNNAVYHRFIEAREVIMGIRSLPRETNVVLTGRYAPPEFLDTADLITLMIPIKHYYRRGYVGIKGLEW